MMQETVQENSKEDIEFFKVLERLIRKISLMWEIHLWSKTARKELRDGYTSKAEIALKKLNELSELLERQ